MTNLDLQQQVFQVKQILNVFFGDYNCEEQNLSNNFIRIYRNFKCFVDCLDNYLNIEKNDFEEDNLIKLLNKITEDNDVYPLEKVLFEVVVIFLNQKIQKNNGSVEEVNFYFERADLLLNNNLIDSFINYMLNHEELENYLDYLNPNFKNIKFSSRFFNIDKEINITDKLTELNLCLKEQDQFAVSATFSYFDGDFTAVNLTDIRDIKDFYGYNETRRQFAEYFCNFQQGIDNSPLLISSFPGLGKTQLTIASTMQYNNMKLILADVKVLEEQLIKLINILKCYPNRKFLIFFDDVEPEKIDWYYFRTHVGGYHWLPKNIAMVIASNYKFPINIQSRGRYIKFPEFDSFIAKEMVTDNLKALKMRNPSEDLVNVITADYLDNFGQQVFQELSPRSLVRYLQKFNNDIKMRAKMLEFANNKIVPIPDEELFHKFNIKMLRSLYGEEAVIEWRNKYLGEDDLMPYIAGK
ncbi:DUF815 domain-containing protein [Lentisphaerota bacterium WC36G]|nr:DUF815 domain-containing protein [Lentisphaerae bacterium WC36]